MRLAAERASESKLVSISCVCAASTVARRTRRFEDAYPHEALVRLINLAFPHRDGSEGCVVQQEWSGNWRKGLWMVGC